MRILIIVTYFSYTSALASNYKFVPPYYNDPRIHNLGNTGLGGRIHAYFAPYATKIIDKLRYDNVDLRKEFLNFYTNYYYKKYNHKPKIIDLCCGVGISTHESAIGIDTSPDMINRAKKLYPNRFVIANAEHYGAINEFDVATIMFSLHEMPSYGYKNVVKNAKYISQNEVLIMDISPTYKPSKLMLSGEPYLENYKKNINCYLKSEGFKSVNLIENHVTLWHYKQKIKNKK